MDEDKAKKIKIAAACMLLVMAGVVYFVLNRSSEPELQPVQVINAPTSPGGAQQEQVPFQGHMAAPSGGR